MQALDAAQIESLKTAVEWLDQYLADEAINAGTHMPTWHTHARVALVEAIEVLVDCGYELDRAEWPGGFAPGTQR